ncbi:MAG: Ig-like domain-containing protein [Chloroflexi bacterium]|nr:Ig-like domain-containing protein [Chloroflexota bacterium]
MKRTLATLVLLVFLVVGWIPIPPGTAQAARLAITVDGIIDTGYGPPIATDPAGDGNGNANLDLLELYATEDATSYYFALKVNADIGATNWGKYALYIDTDGVAGSGATSDAWTRSVSVADPHKPEYAIYTWVDSPPYGPNHTEVYHWTGGAWTGGSSVQVDAAAIGAGATSVIEWQIAKTKLGSPSEFWCEAWDTGGGSSDNAQDTVNDPADDWNATDWSTPATLDCSTHYPVAAPALSLNVTTPTEGQFVSTANIDVTGTVSPTIGATVTVDLNGTDTYTPTIDAGGSFTQPVTLVRGANTITVEATDGVDTRTVVRHVSYGAAHDNDIFWDGLYHDSRDTAYRTPMRAVTTGQAVTLRFRAYADDLTGAKVRVYDDRTDAAATYPMSVVATDGTYDYWSYTIPTQSLPTVLWYRFVAQDGTAIVYYEDDVRDAGGTYRGYNEGGPGKVYVTSPDYSYQITVYDPSFQTPDWMKNAVVYQIFPDRFRNGATANDVVSGTHFMYGNAAGGINYPTWNSEVIDPRNPASPYVDRWSEDFYGGDLQGIAAKLDYLQSVGVTALYLNPVFASPSNHKYDTSNFEQVDDHLGGNAALATLLTEAQARGMHVILDGVFNHTSSDSVYFDKYGRYPSDGAYESQASPYYSWYTFSNWPTNYNSWWGYDTLPILNSGLAAVRDYFWQGADPIATRWIDLGTSGWRMDVGGDIDPGVTRDPANGYWEGFRQAVKTADPNAIIIGEEWGDATPWLLGNEWDAVMNYRFRSANLSFLRDRHYEDNDNNTGSSGGVLDPITPAQLDAWLLSIQEDYPPEAWQAMMNLLDSHDTNRARFVLSKAQIADDTTHTPYNPATDYDPATVDTYQKLLAVLQFTLPGAPTVYYGDEVGLDSPGRWYNSKWEDDPYNRVPFPWADTAGYYSQRATVAAQYTQLGLTRNAHPALRTGDFRSLLTDDADNVYAYGRRLLHGSKQADAAVVIINRDAAAHAVTVDVSGYLGEGAAFADVLNADVPYTVASGQITVPSVPGMGAALLVLTSGDVTPPAAPANLTVTEGQGQVGLAWDAATGAAGYNVYRSLLTGGGYTRIATGVGGSPYTDATVTDGTWYYYVITAVDAAGNESAFSNEAGALPHYTIGWANLQWPYEITHTIGLTPTENIYGQVWIDGVTGQAGATPGLLAQVGYGPTGYAPNTWTEWVDAAFNGDAGNNDEFKGQLLPEETGEFYYVYRYSTTAGRDWAYADRSGIIDPTAKGVVNPGLLHVLSSGDTTAPAMPTNLQVIHWGADHISLAWNPVADGDLYAYDLYRWGQGQTAGDKVRIARIMAPTAVYTDNAVLTNQAYTYTVQALDTSFNRSGFSNEAAGQAVQRQVSVTFNVEIPAFTPAGDTIYIAGDSAPVFGASWNPSHQALTQVDATHWTVTLPASDGARLQYKYTRGSWDKVEKWGWLTGFANRELTVEYGATGAMTVNDTAHNWRDPLVVSVDPPAGATIFDPDDPIVATFSRGLNPTTVSTQTVLVNGGAILGVVSYVSPTITFTPSAPLDAHGRYEVQLTTGIKEAEEGIALQETYIWSFGWWKIWLPLAFKS